MTRALLLANSDQVSRVELMSGLINAVAGKLTTLVGGQAAITAEIARRLHGVRLQTRVEEVSSNDVGVRVRSVGPDGQGLFEDFDACVVACPLPVATSICPDQHEELGRLDKELTFTKGINVAIGTTRKPDTPAFLVLLPRSEDREICMVIVESNKAIDRAPAGHGLLTVSWEMSAAADWIDRSDEDILERTRQTVFRLFPELMGTVDSTFGATLAHRAAPDPPRRLPRDR